MILPGGAPLICEQAMYAPNAPRSLISYRDLRANDIHDSIVVENDEEVLKLRRGPPPHTQPPSKGEGEAGED